MSKRNSLVPDSYAHHQPVVPRGGPVAPAEPQRSPVLRCFADIAPVEVRWLWPDRIPLGRLTLVVGRPGDGKSLAMGEIAARVSTGTKFPDQSNCPLGSVLIISAEDDPADTIRPRLDAAGADVSKVHALSAISYTTSDGKKEERAFTLADIPMLEVALAEIADCKLVIIDPIGSFLGGRVDAHRDNEVRAVLGPLAELAARFDVAIVMIAHRRKGGGDFADDSALGSRAFTGIARAVWHISRDPDDAERRLMLPGKNNLAAPRDGLAFRVEGKSPFIRVAWEDGPVSMSADEAQHSEARSAAQQRKPGPKPTARDAAATWLLTTLSAGANTPVELERLAEKVGHKWRTVQNAANDLKVIREKQGFGGAWLWRLPTTLHPCIPASMHVWEGNPQEGTLHLHTRREENGSMHVCETPLKTNDSSSLSLIDAEMQSSGLCVGRNGRIGGPPD